MQLMNCRKAKPEYSCGAAARTLKPSTSYPGELNLTRGDSFQERGFANTIAADKTVLLTVSQLQCPALKDDELANLDIYVFDANVTMLVDGLGARFS